MHKIRNFHGHSTVGEWRGSGRVVAGSWQGSGRGMAGERHGMCESAFNVNVIERRYHLLRLYCVGDERMNK
jgi:hypothetical protein